MSIDQLTDAECEITECVARRLNVVIEAVEALRRQFERHEAAEDGADPADDEADPVEGEDVCPKCGGSGMIYCGWGEAEYCECRRDWKKEYEDAEEAIGGLVDERDELRAERDAAQARVAELEALYQAGQDYANARCQERSELVAEIDKWKAKAKALEPDAALGALVRRMQRRVIVERLRDGTYSVGLRGEPRVYFRDEERTFAWAADAALGEE